MKDRETVARDFFFFLRSGTYFVVFGSFEFPSEWVERPLRQVEEGVSEFPDHPWPLWWSLGWEWVGSPLGTGGVELW